MATLTQFEFFVSDNRASTLSIEGSTNKLSRSSLFTRVLLNSQSNDVMVISKYWNQNGIGMQFTRLISRWAQDLVEGGSGFKTKIYFDCSYFEYTRVQEQF